MTLICHNRLWLTTTRSWSVCGKPLEGDPPFCLHCARRAPNLAESIFGYIDSAGQDGTTMPDIVRRFWGDTPASRTYRRSSSSAMVHLTWVRQMAVAAGRQLETRYERSAEERQRREWPRRRYTLTDGTNLDTMEGRIG